LIIVAIFVTIFVAVALHLRPDLCSMDDHGDEETWVFRINP
jgi:hypothetical protein